jgi:hypothetical protein
MHLPAEPTPIVTIIMKTDPHKDAALAHKLTACALIHTAWVKSRRVKFGGLTNHNSLVMVRVMADRCARLGARILIRLERRREGLHAQFAVQFRRVIGVSILQHQSDIADRGYVIGWIAVDEYQIGALAALD